MNRQMTLAATAIGCMLIVAWTVVSTGPPEATAPAQPEVSKELRADGAHVARARRGMGASLAEQKAELQRQFELQSKRPVSQGFALTLGEVVFTSGNADLKPSAMGSLRKLVDFLEEYPDRRVAIHGYTDNLGSEEYNQGLSARRADSVRAYLAGQGIDSTRLSAAGLGQSAPVADNDSRAGRQQNRRVEVVVSSPSVTSSPSDTERLGARRAKMLVLIALLESLNGDPSHH